MNIHPQQTQAVQAVKPVSGLRYDSLYRLHDVPDFDNHDNL
jgi:hypothetical protein